MRNLIPYVNRREKDNRKGYTMKPLLTAALCSLISVQLMAKVPEFHEPTLITDGGNPIMLEVGYAAPVVTDWNGDGNKDLLVGQFRSAKIRLYTNLGSDKNPQFEGFEYLKAGGEEIHLTAG